MESIEPANARRKNLIIGIGNEFRGDDGVGIFVISKLHKSDLAGFEIIAYTSEGSGLVELWKNAAIVIIIDAAFSGSTPGTIYRFEVDRDTIPATLFKGYSSHAIGLFEAVEISRTLDSLPQKMIIYGIEGKSYEMGTGLSSEILESAEKVTMQILGEAAG